MTGRLYFNEIWRSFICYTLLPSPNHNEKVAITWFFSPFVQQLWLKLWLVTILLATCVAFLFPCTWSRIKRPDVLRAPRFYVGITWTAIFGICSFFPVIPVQFNSFLRKKNWIEMVFIEVQLNLLLLKVAIIINLYADQFK